MTHLLSGNSFLPTLEEEVFPWLRVFPLVRKRLGQSPSLNCLWIVEQDAVVEWVLLR